jgi:hypothetical protein
LNVNLWHCGVRIQFELGSQKLFWNKARIQLCLFSPAATTATYNDTHKKYLLRVPLKIKYFITHCFSPYFRSFDRINNLHFCKSCVIPCFYKNATFVKVMLQFWRYFIISFIISHHDINREALFHSVTLNVTAFLLVL